MASKALQAHKKLNYITQDPLYKPHNTFTYPPPSLN